MSRKTILAVMAATTALISLPAQAAVFWDNFDVTIENPGVSGSSAGFDYTGVETFDGPGVSTGIQNLVSTFGGSPITGTYKGVNIIPSDQYGGAGNTGHYAVAGINLTESYSIEFSQTGAQGINYFGYWLSALDAGNTVEFFNDGSSLGTFSQADVLSLVGPGGLYYNGGDYFGKPGTGENTGEPYVFVNFYAKTGTFDEIVFKQTNIGAGYESDNHTVGWYDEQGGNPVPAVPEPSTWAMMILGFGAVGGAMRTSRRKTRTSLTYA